jgi:hypothetical protein
LKRSDGVRKAVEEDRRRHRLAVFSEGVLGDARSLASKERGIAAPLSFLTILG